MDLSRLPPCSLCTQYLADLGADVLKIEPTASAGERAIGYASEPSPPPGEMGVHIAAYNSLNRNKKSLGLNLKSEDGKQIFYKLAKNADVIFEGFRPGVTNRLGVDYETMKKINPKIIYCSLTGYGQDGPYALLPGHDITYIATGGALYLIGEPDGPPSIPLNYVGDSAGGTLHAIIAILTALIARERTGMGQYIDVSMTDGVVSLQGMLSVWYFQRGVIPQRGKSPIDGQFPNYGVYQTKDGGYIAIGCIEPYFWENLCREMGLEEFVPCPTELSENTEEMRATLRRLFLTKTKEEWFDQLAPKNIPIAKVYSMDEVFSDPQVLARQMVLDLNHPTLGQVKQTGFPMKFSETPGKVRNFAPFFGQHTDEVLKELGYKKAERKRLRQEGVVG